MDTIGFTSIALQPALRVASIFHMDYGCEICSLGFCLCPELLCQNVSIQSYFCILQLRTIAASV